MSPRAILAVLAAALLLAAFSACGDDGGEAGDNAPGDTAAQATEQRTERGVPLTPGGDNSIQEFGEEAGDAQRAAALRALRRYFAARAAQRWGESCRYLSRPHRAEVSRIAAGPAPTEGRGCAAAVAYLDENLPRQWPHADGAELELVSLRAEGDRAIAIYRAEGRFYYIPMQREGDEWRIAQQLTGTILILPAGA